jgi:lipoprotein-anchoring transpeptidase ErfK/SrfK
MQKSLVCCFCALMVSTLAGCASSGKDTTIPEEGIAQLVAKAEQAAAPQSIEEVVSPCPPPVDPCPNMCCVPVIPVEPESREYVVTKQDKEEAKKAGKDIFAYLFADSAANVSRFNRLDPRFAYVGRKIRVPELPAETLYTPMPERYDPALQSPKYILIDLSKQFLGLYECGYLAASYPISSGQESHRTPAGDTSVMTKVVNHKSSVYPEPYGGAPMPHALRIRGWSYWIHGGDLVGYPASHGCIREMYDDAKKVFSWADIGTPVKIVKKLG